jgi:hypothetical protein
VIGHSRVVDSSGIADGVVTQDTVSLICSAIRRCLGLLDELPPQKAQSCRASLAGDDYDRPGKPEICWASEEECRVLINELFNDGCRVIIACAGISDPALSNPHPTLAVVLDILGGHQSQQTNLGHQRRLGWPSPSPWALLPGCRTTAQNVPAPWDFGPRAGYLAPTDSASARPHRTARRWSSVRSRRESR